MTPRSRHPPAVQYPLQRSAVLGALLVCWLLGSAMVLAAWVVLGARSAWAAGWVAAGLWLLALSGALHFLLGPVSRAVPWGGPGRGVGVVLMGFLGGGGGFFGDANAGVAGRASDGTAPHLAVAGAIEPARALARPAPCGIFARQTGHRQC